VGADIRRRKPVFWWVNIPFGVELSFEGADPVNETGGAAGCALYCLVEEGCGRDLQFGLEVAPRGGDNLSVNEGDTG